MACHPYGMKGIEQDKAMIYLAHLVAMHNDVQIFSNDMTYYSRIRTCRNTVLNSLGKDAAKDEADIAKAKLQRTPNDYDEYVNIGVTTTQIKANRNLWKLVLTMLQVNSDAAAYAKMRQVLSDYDEWNLLNNYFDQVAEGNILGCAVRIDIIVLCYVCLTTCVYRLGRN